MTDRRKSPRPESVFTVIEDITYSVLRSHSYSPENQQEANLLDLTTAVQQ